MKRFENILFVTQGLPGHNDALAHNDALGQALRIAASNGVPVSGLIACQQFPTGLADYQMALEQSLIESLQRSADHARHTNAITQRDVGFPIVLESGDQPAVTIIRHVVANHCDLVIKEAEPIDDDAEGFKAMDMTLLRKCPSALWLHRAMDKPRNKRRVAVAVDPMSKDEVHRKLSLRLLELSRSIADTCDSRLHIVSCWENYLESYLDGQAWFQFDKEQIATEVAAAKLEHKQALETLISEANISGDCVVHHLHGKPDETIPDCVNEQHIDVLVMGTLARTGIAGLFIGNTAENILQSVRCSLVALKPDGFVSPIN